MARRPALTTPFPGATIFKSPSIAGPAFRRHCSYGGRTLSQETIARILSIEREAANLYADAERHAADLIAEAKEATAAIQEHTLAQARREAENIVSRGREAAEAERARIIAQAETEAQRTEALAERHFDRAVAYVLDQVAGRG